ncbi:MAG: hypothetical protein KC964_18390 [Candidatus Omnitrophica bacterium]|nr:hypothetical protein [Candidatus Omnitrophota bacterium]
MKNFTDKLTASSHEDDWIDLGQDLTERADMDLLGQHPAEIVSIHPRKTKSGDPIQSVGARILEGAGKDEMVYGPVYKGQGLERFVRALGLDPKQVGSKLAKNQAIGKTVLIEVAPEEREGAGGAIEKSWVIRGFAPLA